MQRYMTAARSQTMAAIAENPLAQLTFGLGREGSTLIGSLGFELGAVGTRTPCFTLVGVNQGPGPLSVISGIRCRRGTLLSGAKG
jgi:hypothetical protein